MVDSDVDLRRERGILFTLVAAQFVSIVDFMIIMPLGPQLMRTMDISPAQFGIVVSSYTGAAGTAGLIASSLIDRVDRKTAFLGLYLGFLLGTLLCAIAPTYHLLVCARILTGAFGGVLGGTAHAIIGDVFPQERRGRAMGALMSAFALASVAGVPLGIALGTHFSWHVPFYALAGIGSLIFPVAAMNLPSLTAHMNRLNPVSPVQVIRSTFAPRSHQLAFALSSLIMMGSFTVIPFLSTFVVANVGMTEHSLPLLYVVGGGCTLFTAPLCGKLVDKFGTFPVFRIVVPLSALVMLSVTLTPPGQIVLAIITGALLMVINSSRMLTAMAMITNTVSVEKRGSFMSANSSVQHLSAGVGAFISGHIIQKASGGQLTGYPIVGVLSAGLAVLTFLCGLSLSRIRTQITASATEPPPVTAAAALAAAAVANSDAGEPMSDIV